MYLVLAKKHEISLALCQAVSAISYVLYWQGKVCVCCVCCVCGVSQKESVRKEQRGCQSYVSDVFCDEHMS